MDPRVEEFLKKRRKERDGKPKLLKSDLAESLGRIPPQAPDIEEAVLGAMLLESHCVDTAMLMLSRDTFYRDNHQIIFTAIANLYANSKPVDLLTVTSELRRMGQLEMVGGAFYLTELTNKISSSANVETHALILHEKYIKRMLLKVGSEITRDSYDDTNDALELLDRSYKDLNHLTDALKLHRPTDIRKIIDNNLLVTSEYMKDDREITGIASGFYDLDRITLGWQKTDLVVIASRPGMGKTALVLAIARTAAVEHKKRVAFFSLEMSAGQLVMRMQSMESSVPLSKIRSGRLQEHQFEALCNLSYNLAVDTFVIDDTSNLSILQLRAACFRLARERGVDLIIIDYLQLMQGQGDTREQEISYISRNLKALAKDLDVPVLALSQLSRAVEQRGGDKRPQLSDLRESGGIEQDADIVIFLYRPSYYKIYQDSEGNDIRNKAELIIAKHRNGPLDSAFLIFNEATVKFVPDTPVAEFIPSPINARLHEDYKVKSPDRDDYMEDTKPLPGVRDPEPGDALGDDVPF